MNKKKMRRCYFIDPDVQTGLMKRLCFYWLASILFLTLPIAFAKCLVSPEIAFVTHIASVYIDHWPIFVMLFVFLPFALNDAIKYSNRFVGPIYRLRSELKKFAMGQQMKPIKFRNGDFWHDLSDGINELTARLNELEALQDHKPQSESPEPQSDSEQEESEEEMTASI